MHQHTAEGRESAEERAVRLIRETADAQRRSAIVRAETLREEADYIEDVLAMARRAMAVATKIEETPT